MFLSSKGHSLKQLVHQQSPHSCILHTKYNFLRY